MAGKVYFVGSGPGDPDLLTVRALDLIRNCDAVVYDALVTAPIIEKIPAGSLRVPVRETPSEKGMNITSIGTTLVDLAMAGMSVIRLKSGDPLIFGRLWEETDYLDAAGIQYEIVPGISSAFSSAAFAGIPITDRRFSSSVAIVTGHEAKDKKSPAVDWKGLAKTVDTIIVLMGSSSMAEYSKKLIDAGVDGSTALTIVCNASRENQRVIGTTLAETAEGKVVEHDNLCTVIISIGASRVKQKSGSRRNFGRVKLVSAEIR